MENKKIDMNYIFEVCQALKEHFKGIESLPYGYCCGSDYYAYIDKEEQNDDDYVSAKIYKDGLNNNFNYDSEEFELRENVYFNWGLKNFDLDKVIDIMQGIADDYDYKVIKPINESECIKVITN